MTPRGKKRGKKKGNQKNEDAAPMVVAVMVFCRSGRFVRPRNGDDLVSEEEDSREDNVWINMMYVWMYVEFTQTFKMTDRTLRS